MNDHGECQRSADSRLSLVIRSSALGHDGDQASCVAAHEKKQEPFRRADRTRAGVVTKSGDGHLECGTLVLLLDWVKSKIWAVGPRGAHAARAVMLRVSAMNAHPQTRGVVPTARFRVRRQLADASQLRVMATVA
jgi:hypothetical protein